MGCLNAERIEMINGLRRGLIDLKEGGFEECIITCERRKEVLVL